VLNVFVEAAPGNGGYFKCLSCNTLYKSLDHAAHAHRTSATSHIPQPKKVLSTIYKLLLLY